MCSQVDSPGLGASIDLFQCDFCSTIRNREDIWKCNKCVDHYICTACFTVINLNSLLDGCFGAFTKMEPHKLFFSTPNTSLGGIRPDLTTIGDQTTDYIVRSSLSQHDMPSSIQCSDTQEQFRNKSLNPSATSLGITSNISQPSNSNDANIMLDMSTSECATGPKFGFPSEKLFGSELDMSSSVKLTDTSCESIKEISQISNVCTPALRETTDQSMRPLCVQDNVYAESVQTDHDKLFTKDDASRNFLCMENIHSNCQQDNCNRLHSDTHLPYFWQIKLFGNCWFTLPNAESVEQIFCSPEEEEYSCKFTYACEHLDCKIVFGTMHWASISGEYVEARRLSTMSFNEASDVGGSYVTQWRWYWKDNDGQWIAFEPDSLQHTLEAKFLAKQTTYMYWLENYKCKYKIDFDSMTQQNVQTGATRPLRRRPVFVSYKDVHDKITPPCLAPPQVIDVALPPSWVPWDVAHPFELVQLSDSDTELNEVSTNFFKTTFRDEFTITAVFRIQNHALLSAFCNHEKVMMNNQRRLGNRSPVDKRHLFHGTDSMGSVRGICVNNFDFRLSGKNATMYGHGAYFARDAKYSHTFTKPDEQKERFMLLAQVLVGSYTKGDSQYRRPPEKPDKDHELFDSCVDDEHNPSMFILFDKNAYYPEYLIQYTDTDNLNVASPQPVVLWNASNPSSSTMASVAQQALPPQTTKRSRKPRSKKASQSMLVLQPTTSAPIATKRSRSKKSKSNNAASVSNSVPPLPVQQAPPPSFRPYLSLMPMSSTAMPQTPPVPSTTSSVLYSAPVLAQNSNQLSQPPSNVAASFIASSLPSSQMHAVSSNISLPSTAQPLATPQPYSTAPTVYSTPARAHSYNSLSLAHPNGVGSPWYSMFMPGSNSTYSVGNPPPAHTTHSPFGYPFHENHQFPSIHHPRGTETDYESDN